MVADLSFGDALEAGAALPRTLRLSPTNRHMSGVICELFLKTNFIEVETSSVFIGYRVDCSAWGNTDSVYAIQSNKKRFAFRSDDETCETLPISPAPKYICR